MDKKILKDVIYYLSNEQGLVASVIEKDFHLTRILNKVNRYLITDIVFKGGTLLNKKPERVTIKHFFQDPFTGEDLIEQGKVLALSLEESVAEKLKAAISRITPAIRDYYDLGHFIRNGFDFNRSDFLKMVDKKLRLDGYVRDYSYNLGLSEQAIKELKRSINANLALMIRRDEKFDLDEVLVFFNKLFKKK